MGVIGVCLLGCIVSLFKSVVSLFRYVSWKKKPIVKGRVGDCLRKENIKNVLKYYYAFTLETDNGEVITEFVSAVKQDDTPSVKSGDEIEVFYDAEQKNYREIKSLKKELWQYPVTFLICLVIMVICFFIVD